MIDNFNNIVSGDEEYNGDTSVGNSSTTDDTYHQSMLPIDQYSLYPVTRHYRHLNKERDIMPKLKIVNLQKKKVKNDLLKLANGYVDELDFFRNYGIKDKELIKNILFFVKKKNNINESNSLLRGKKTIVPNYIIRSIKEEINNLNGEKPKGYQFAQNIIKNPFITYENLKRKLNLFQKMESMDCLESKLMGGSQMFEFITKTLENWRNYIKKNKNLKAKAGLYNTHIKTHEKN